MKNKIKHTRTNKQLPKMTTSLYCVKILFLISIKIFKTYPTKIFWSIFKVRSHVIIDFSLTGNKQNIDQRDSIRNIDYA